VRSCQLLHSSPAGIGALTSEEGPLVRLLLPLVLSCCAPWVATASADSVTHTWPTDPPPCDAASTLQACVDSAGDGDVVEIATSGPIDESISFQKSLTLRAAQGFAPAFASTQSIFADTPASGSHSITIEGLTLSNGLIRVLQLSMGALDVAIRDNNLEGPIGNFAIEVTCTISTITPNDLGPCTFDISGNVLVLPSTLVSPFQNESIGIGATLTTDASGRIVNNSIAIQGQGPFDSGISLSASGPLGVDVIANQIVGRAYDSGIFLFSSGTIAARILDNLVIGGRSAIQLSSIGVLTSLVANNTVADGVGGITAYALGGGTIGGLIANNIVSGNSQTGILVDPSFANRNNLVFGNGSDSYTPGPSTIGADPLFVDPQQDNYHLQAGSPAIDTGDDGSVPTDLTTDLDGNPRIQGAHVDIGAYETAPEPDAQALAATALAALLGVAMHEAARLRARRAA